MRTLDESFSRVLAVVAHPDDLEYGASSAVARWTARGKWVGYVMVSDGEAGIDSTPPAEAGPLRRKEQVESAEIVGVSDVRFLGYADGTIDYTGGLRRDLAAEIRRWQPDMLLTATHRLTFGDNMLNQADHRNVALALLDAAKDAGNRWIHPELLDAGLEPHTGVRATMLMGSTEATDAVDVTDTLEVGVRSLEAHGAYLEGLGRDFSPGAFLFESTRGPGSAIGVRNAVAFEVISNQGI